MNRITFCVTTTLLFAASIVLPAQSGQWKIEPFVVKGFIENKGQFERISGRNDSHIIYGSNSQGTEMYFTPTGIFYKHDQVVDLTSEEKEEAEMKNAGMETEHQNKVVPQYLDMEWLGADANCRVERENKLSPYFTYPSDGSVNAVTIVVNAFEKITYKDLYPGIDVEYTFPNGKEGIKYTLQLHPGADITKVKMRYTGAGSLSTDGDGNLVIESTFGPFVDHAPQTFYTSSKKSIHSSFAVNANIVSFNVSSFDSNESITVDPWTTNPNFPTYNNAYDVNYDTLGNVYAYGGGYPWQLAKFTPSGVLLWTYSASGMYNPGCYTGACYGDFTVDLRGNSYLGEGFDFVTGARIFKVSTNGIQVSSTPGDQGMNELWRLEYAKNINTLIGVGGGTSGYYQTIHCDTALTTPVLVNTDGISASGNDEYGLAIDPISNFCYKANYNNSPVNKMCKVPIPSLTTSSWIVNNGFSFQEIASVPYVLNAPGNANGFNAMAASVNWLYAYNGAILKQFDKNTGVEVAFVASGGTQYSSGGTTVDGCDNVYVGVGNVIKQYDPLLSFITSIPTAGATYDCKVGWNKDKLYACGAGFVSQFDIIVCDTITGIKDVAANTAFTYYPNPTNGLVHFELRDRSNMGKELVIKLYNVIGMELKEKTFTGETTLELGDVAQGIYSFKIFDKEKTIQNGKIVVVY